LIRTKKGIRDSVAAVVAMASAEEKKAGDWKKKIEKKKKLKLKR